MSKGLYVIVSEIPSQRPGVNAWAPEFLENLYHSWKQDPQSVDPQWQLFFQGFELGSEGNGGGAAGQVVVPSQKDFDKHARVQSLVYHYRDVGHLMATLDPLGRPRVRPQNLELECFNLSESDLDDSYSTSICAFSGRPHKLRDIIAYLEQTYCANLGAEYMHIQNTVERRWMQERLECRPANLGLTPDYRRHLLHKLHQSEIFESFLHKAYPNEKRFSLEGSETVIALLATALDRAAEAGVVEGVLGMAHRGRLNVLANIMHKGYDDIFAEFEANYVDTYMGGGDVKYHKGYSSDYMTFGGELVHLTLAANPSHLEAVDPVVMGRARAKQRVRGDSERKIVLPILMHGDAAFAGQGMVAETLQMAMLPGYCVGGTLHLIINNQIGFTTDPTASRSSAYCTDIAKAVQAPIFHVNGEDPDLCAFVMQLAIDYRQRFGKDVVVDMWCYRKYGHNEGDEPSYTQPRMYDIIRKKEPIRQLYSRKLVEAGVIDQPESDRMQVAMEQMLSDAQEHGRTTPVSPNQLAYQQQWVGYNKRYTWEPVDTTFPKEKLQSFAPKLIEAPESFNVNSKLKRILQRRRDTVLNDEPMEWGTVELLAYASLLSGGTPVRLSGQDSRRGTFSHRHAVLVDVNTEEPFIPLNTLHEGQARFCVYDSPLSEVSVLGFDYGYSIAEPQMLIIWEAQFGDFANGAQVIIDQFLASAEVKWDRSSGIVLLLPHGYEGQGPEHSSARLERFLQLCAEENMQVANLTTPAQFFHIIRRQMFRKFRKPLVIMSPKSLLRHPECTSRLDDLANGSFKNIMDDPHLENKKAVQRLVFCTGKVYYDLHARRMNVDASDSAIIRLEQIYPLHEKMMEEILAGYPNAKEFIWCQEEPRNMGAWSHIREAMEEKFDLRLRYVGRPASATPAVGSKKLHDKEQALLVSTALPARSEAAVG